MINKKKFNERMSYLYCTGKLPLTEVARRLRLEFNCSISHTTVWLRLQEMGRFIRPPGGKPKRPDYAVL